MGDDYIDVVWTTDKGKKVEYINRDTLENPIKKGIMKKVMIASLALPLMFVSYHGVKSTLPSIQNKIRSFKNYIELKNIENYSNILPYNLPESIEEKVNKNVEYIKKYKSYKVESELSKVSKFEDIIESASKKTGLSKYLLMSVPAVEAGGELDMLKAKSHKGAVGPAQFMEETAKYRGMNIDHYEDERMSPSIALPKMAEYLDDLIDQFGGKIHLGLAAYNWGPGNVESLINSPNKKGKTFIDRLPSETEIFIIRVLSRETLMRKNMISYNKEPLFSEMLADAEDYIVNKGDTIDKIAMAYNGDDIIKLNPQIKNPNNLKPGQKIKVKK